MPHDQACLCEECLAFRKRQEQIELYLRVLVFSLGFIGLCIAGYAFWGMAFP